ncbi:MAG: DUF561 domain-containing protein [bacterium]|nr:DUF561 domain-containing protein [bacterium]
MSRIDLFKKALEEKKAVKVIAGIDNFDGQRVRNVVIAAQKGGAHAVDIAADAGLIRMAKETCELPIFVSSTSPDMLAMAAKEGADALEIGNFDALYRKGLRIGADEVLELVRETRELVGEEIFLSVTIPGHISVAEQVELARALEALDVDLIQSEGACVANVNNDGARGMMEKVNVSIANTMEIINACSVPVMTASGITPATALMPFAAGASAIGVGSCINKLSSALEMTATVMSIMEKVGAQKEERILA